ncbi:hypothetical protein SH668x_000881 [Planctomicrobium sp. SH668]|uniref:hypothetical protein n=1 Tax=Planctomicrobium sp. SH668 TaxID=3448126 RepID=UPI003F5B1335
MNEFLPPITSPGTAIYRYSGENAINLNHYWAVSLDSSEPGLLWTVQAYGKSNIDKRWCTCWAAFWLTERKSE